MEQIFPKTVKRTSLLYFPLFPFIKIKEIKIEKIITKEIVINRILNVLLLLEVSDYPISALLSFTFAGNSCFIEKLLRALPYKNFSPHFLGPRKLLTLDPSIELPLNQLTRLYALSCSKVLEYPTLLGILKDIPDSFF